MNDFQCSSGQTHLLVLESNFVVAQDCANCVIIPNRSQYGPYFEAYHVEAERIFSLATRLFLLEISITREEWSKAGSRQHIC